MTKDFEDTINKDEVSIVWRGNIYDGCVLEGHCWYKQQYCLIISNGPWSKEVVFKIYKLSGQDLINELAHRKLFEDIVGYHLTSNVKNYSPCNSPKDIKLYYDNMKHLIPAITKEKVETLEYLGGWSYDNSKYWDEEDESDD